MPINDKYFCRWIIRGPGYHHQEQQKLPLKRTKQNIKNKIKKVNFSIIIFYKQIMTN